MRSRALILPLLLLASLAFAASSGRQERPFQTRAVARFVDLSFVYLRALAGCHRSGPLGSLQEAITTKDTKDHEGNNCRLTLTPGISGLLL